MQGCCTCFVRVFISPRLKASQIVKTFPCVVHHSNTLIWHLLWDIFIRFSTGCIYHVSLRLSQPKHGTTAITWKHNLFQCHTSSYYSLQKEYTRRTVRPMTPFCLMVFILWSSYCMEWVVGAVAIKQRGKAKQGKGSSQSLDIFSLSIWLTALPQLDKRMF